MNKTLTILGINNSNREIIVIKDIENFCSKNLVKLNCLNLLFNNTKIDVLPIIFN